MRFSFQTVSDIGNKRESNQDYIYAREITTAFGRSFLGVVCDGMGGLSKGEIASKTVADIFANWFEEEFRYILSNSDLFMVLKTQWEILISAAKSILCDISNECGEALGTTLSLLLLADGKYYVAQIGDSRIYLFRDSSSFRITTDHSYVMELADKGLMTYDEANLAKNKNILTRCIGSMGEFSADYYMGDVCKNDFFLISSDGFHGNKTDAEMREIIFSIFNSSEHDRETAIKKAITNKINEGESDNISAICVKVNRIKNDLSGR